MGRTNGGREGRSKKEEGEGERRVEKERNYV